jgi:hypothetical protein
VARESHSGKSLGAWLDTAGEAVIGVFHPAGCELCDQLLTRASCVPICGECLASFSALPQTVCEVCGSPVVAPFSLRVMNPAEDVAEREQMNKAASKAPFARTASRNCSISGPCPLEDSTSEQKRKTSPKRAGGLKGGKIMGYFAVSKANRDTTVRAAKLTIYASY